MTNEQIVNGLLNVIRSYLKQCNINDGYYENEILKIKSKRDRFNTDSDWERFYIRKLSQITSRIIKECNLDFVEETKRIFEAGYFSKAYMLFSQISKIPNREEAELLGDADPTVG